MAQREARLRVPLPSRALHYLPATALILDAASISAAILVAYIGRGSWNWAVFNGPTDVHPEVGWVGLIAVVLWLLSTWGMGGYSRSLFDAGADEFRRVARAGFMTAGLLGVGVYLAKFDLARGFFVLAFLIGIPAVLVGRLLLRTAVRTARTHGALRHTVLICGTPHSADDIAAVLRRERKLGYQVVGVLTPSGHEEETPSGLPVVGRCSDITGRVFDTGADVVFFADGGVASADAMRRIAWDLEKHEVQVVVAPSVSEVSGERVRIRPVGGLPLIHVDPPRVTDAARWGKRTFDTAAAGLLVFMLSPLFLYAALRVKLHDGGPVLFRQKRTGRDGEEFHCLKFRTMVVDAEERLRELHEQTGHAGGLFKMAEDPRITKPGRTLRRYSIDELPQLFNVLRGEMSLVGPRPPLPSEVAQYDEQTSRRLRVRPGLTGLWQVSGRSDLAWDEAVRLDLYYVDNWSMLQDASILLKTVRAVFTSSGAY